MVIMKKRIYNKIQSIEYIKMMDLNRFPEKLFKNNMEKDMLKFMDDYPAKYYAIRDNLFLTHLFLI
jgi:hypothetical protein